MIWKLNLLIYIENDNIFWIKVLCDEICTSLQIKRMPLSSKISFTPNKVFCFNSFISSSIGIFFFSNRSVFITKLCLHSVIFFSSRLFLIVIFRRVSQFWVKSKNSWETFCFIWNCIRMCVHGCDVSVTTNIESFLNIIACLSTQLKVFHPADDCVSESWKKCCSLHLRKIFEMGRASLYELTYKCDRRRRLQPSNCLVKYIL